MRLNKLLFLSIFFIISINLAYAESSCDIYFFYSKTCPHCAEEAKFLEGIQNKYPELHIQYLEVSENYDLFEQINKKYNSIPVGVPRIIINGTVFIGFTEEQGPLYFVKGYEAYNGFQNQIEEAILEHLESHHKLVLNETCAEEQSEGEKTNYIFVPFLLLISYLIFFALFRKKIHKRYFFGILFAIIILTFFYLSQHLPSIEIISFANQFSFPFFTFIIALLDGFNPCAFAVLAILLSLLIHAQSKKKMALIGIIFILTSSVMYFLFIIVLLTLRTELLGAHKDIIRIIVGFIALIAGAINIKDFFFFKKGISLTISEKKISKITAKMRNVVNEVKEAQTSRALFLAIIETIILAALVNLLELGCTLILPIQYIEILITNYGTHVSLLHCAYIAFYCLIYVVPLFAILASFLYTFKSERMTETKGRLLKLISGLVMLGLGLILLIKPELLTFG